MKTLHLTLHKRAFDVMVTGEKNEEFRKGGAWIESRLCNPDGTAKKYDQIKFVNGYSNGLQVRGIDKGDYIIICGKILETGNLRT